MKLAITGHRPFKLPTRNMFPNNCGLHRRLLHETAVHFIEQLEPELIIVGGAHGWDTTLALAAASCKIPFELHVPWRGYNDRQTGLNGHQWKYQKAHAQTIVHVSDNHNGNHAEKLFKRNISMVDAADEVLALLDPAAHRGGTLHAVNYANKLGKPVHLAWEKMERFLDNLETVNELFPFHSVEFIDWPF